jgi:hypothetical protein
VRYNAFLSCLGTLSASVLAGFALEGGLLDINRLLAGLTSVRAELARAATLQGET